MNATDIRSASDLALYEKLLDHPDVKRVNERIARAEEEGPTGIRRNLLATSVRLTERMAPDIAAMATECIAELGVELPLEMYVYSSPQFNAACFKPEKDRLHVMFSSSLIEGFDASEFKFVMGHELGHHVYDHHAIPIGYLLRGNTRPDPKLALELFAWSRYAEISADRAGAHCAQDMGAVARALFKLSSGLTTRVVAFSLDDFVAQVDEMETHDQQPGQGSSQADWFATHPFSPLRVKALKYFEDSVLYKAGTDQLDKEALELKVQAVMSLMEPSYIDGKTDAAVAMRRLLFAGLIAVANASDGISDAELKTFEKFFGKHAFTDKLDIDRIVASMDKRIRAVREHASEPQRMQVLHDICVMTQADGGVTEAERGALDQIASGLEISKAFICQVLDDSKELD